MNFTIIQPRYSTDYDKVDDCFQSLLALMDKCDATSDVIVLPECSDVPANVRNKAEYERYVAQNTGILLDKAAATARRCNAVVFVNAACKCENGLRNTTHIIGKDGGIEGKYFKAHPAPSEVRSAQDGGMDLDVAYSYSFNEPYIKEIDGVRYAFLTCYDFYFYEGFARIAKEKPDVIIGCSLQRTDRHSALEIIGRFLSYNTDSYLVRSSVSLGENSETGGSSMIVTPDGTVLRDMKNEVGIATVSFDPKAKYLKPAGFSGALKPHCEYIEEGRRPWNYLPAGSAIIPGEKICAYPRVCAHRGFSTVAPENSMPAFGAAIALGAQEIEFDLWPTKDGEIVSCHDPKLDRVSTGSGFIYEHTLAQLREYDFGVKFSQSFKGLSIVKFEDILSRFSCHTIMNIHIKPISLTERYPEDAVRRIVALIRKYDAQKHCYLMLEPDIHIQQFKKYAPDIPVCVGNLADRPWEIVERAIALGAEKVQFVKPYFTVEKIELAHSHGISCNVFWSDDEDETRQFLQMGIDTILTNNYLQIANTVKQFTENNG